MKMVDQRAADEALKRLEVDDLGLDAMDRRYLRLIADHYGGGPVGVETLAAALSEQRDTIEDAIEPYLIQQGLLQRSSARAHADAAPAIAISASRRRATRRSSICWRHRRATPPMNDVSKKMAAPGAPMASHRQAIRVYFEDTDAAGIVYYANYLKFAERARTDMLRDFGVSHADMMKRDGLVLVVRRCEIDYLKPARLDDLLTVETEVAKLGGASRRSPAARAARRRDPCGTQGAGGLHRPGRPARPHSRLCARGAPAHRTSIRMRQV